MSLIVFTAPSAFKESLLVKAVAKAISCGLRRTAPMVAATGASMICTGARQTCDRGSNASAAIMRGRCSRRKAIGTDAKPLRQAAQNAMRRRVVGGRPARRPRV